MTIHYFKSTLGSCFVAVLFALVCVGCSSKHPQVIEASPEQQKQWEDEENAANQKKLEEARAAGQVR